MSKQRTPKQTHDAQDTIDKNARLDRLLVEGELVDDDNGKPMRVYPMSMEIAKRLGVSPSWVSKYARANRCFERRAELKAKIEAKAHEELARHEAKRVAFDTERTLRLCDKVLEKYEEAIVERGVGRVTSADINTMVRLRRYLQGDSESRHEIRNSLTLESVQAAHRELLFDIQNLTAAECGMEDDDQNPRAASVEDGDSEGLIDHEIDPKEADMDVH